MTMTATMMKTATKQKAMWPPAKLTRSQEGPRATLSRDAIAAQLLDDDDPAHGPWDLLLVRKLSAQRAKATGHVDEHILLNHREARRLYTYLRDLIEPPATGGDDRRYQSTLPKTIPAGWRL